VGGEECTIKHKKKKRTRGVRPGLPTAHCDVKLAKARPRNLKKEKRKGKR